ncbi:MAG: hypothetical protein AABW89_00660 [Nanoarchaeota archaeon]
MFSSKKCQRCEGKLKEEYSFCPYCRLDLRNPEADIQDFGMLGKNDSIFGAPMIGGGSMGISDSVFNSIFNGVMKMMESQMRNLNPDGLDFGDARPEVRQLPNGIQIKIGPKKQPKEDSKIRVINDDQKARMAKLPRSRAKTEVRRLSDKVVYELMTPGVEDVNDIFVSKVESGYEVKALGRKKIYFNSLQVNLPLKRYSVKDGRLALEFALE